MLKLFTRKTKFDLRKAQEREHIVTGLLKAIGQMDAIIKTIKESQSTEEARSKLVEIYELTEIQASAILEMQLRRLTGLETERLENEHKTLFRKNHWLTKATV